MIYRQDDNKNQNCLLILIIIIFIIFIFKFTKKFLIKEFVNDQMIQ